MSMRLVAEVNRQLGWGLKVSGVASQGQSGGAVFVRWPDGREGVVTTGLVSWQRMVQTAEVLGEVRERGIPVPRIEAVVPVIRGRTAVVQEKLPGATITEAGAETVDAIVAMNDRFAGLLADRADVPGPQVRLSPAHGLLEQYGARSSRLLDRIRELDSPSHGGPASSGAGAAGLAIDGDDLVHPDLTVPNVLFGRTGAVTGVVDWNLGVARGDRRFGLVKLLFDLTWAAGVPSDEQRPAAAALDRIEEVVHTTIPADRLRRYWACQTLAMLSWTIHARDTEAINLHLALGERGLG
ncbi:aminoglycoside phosphotransferase [Kribbella flavida DSM 17836]|uniref:Aminoglycoside phosphotransferase n=1 Tax=Kribbella flavida (strain DSM 17836 / JCM 10339 / NBRC 14399) TaxID=479435 RepID=D2PVE9_KRIFD|nr:phosphotransferase [Kribbella flavida]ADB33430.1 aminoglycoside phosphotransferase [Kribbella flavida DSM 17836]